MPLLTPPASDVFPQSTVAAILLAAIPHLGRLGLPHPSATEVIEATQTSRSQAYMLKARLATLLEQLVRPSGRPPTPKQEAPPPLFSTEVLRYVADHPGAISGGAARRRYSAGLRVFVLDLIECHPEISLETFAESTTIPLGTLKDWLRGEALHVEAPAETRPPPRASRGPEIQTLLEEWQHWDGQFIDFCDHVQQNCRLPFGRSLIATILEGCGVRIRKRRKGRSPDENALRAAFRTFFPNAQWVGDGSQVSVEVDGEAFTFNVELNVDAYSGAFVGADISPVEDSAAVIATFHNSAESTGAKPIALLLDNKPSNHTAAVDQALDGTLRIRSTPHRAQNKAHVEGGYGLLKPTLADLVLESGSPKTLAESYLRNLVTTAARAINQRPRRDRGGKSRLDLLQDTPTNEEIKQARVALAELQRKQRKARETLAARQDPVVRARIKAAYERLELEDPQGHLLTATARYPIDAIVEGIAIFEGKRRARTLAEGVDARYLLGIVRNVAAERETWDIAEALWEERTAAADLLARHLERRRSAVHDAAVSPETAILSYIVNTIDTNSRLERFFWLAAAADAIKAEASDTRHGLFRLCARRIAATRTMRPRERSAAIRFLAAKIINLR